MEEIVLLGIINNSLDVFTEQLMLFNELKNRREEDELFISSIIIYFLRDKHEKIGAYYDEWLPRYLEHDFFSLYRMSRETFMNLLISLNCEDKEYVGGETPVPLEKQLLMTLWWLGKGEVLISIADRFNVALSTVFNCTEFILQKLITLKTRYITWPNVQEAVEIENGFRNRGGFPGVIGAVDGTCIKFKPPKEQQNSYIDKDLNHSLKLQAVVSHNKLLTNIVAGFPGSAHDSRNSHLFEETEENGNRFTYFFNNNLHLVGDKAYPLRTWIMTPYKDNGRLNAVQRHYNYCLSKTRIVVEHVFGILKSRWAILQYINVNSVVKAVKIIVACCVLHNFCYINFDYWNAYEPPLENNDEDYGGDEPMEAGLKRNELANQLF